MLEVRYNFKITAINTDVVVIGGYKNKFHERSLYSVELFKKIRKCWRYQMYPLKIDTVMKTIYN